MGSRTARLVAILQCKRSNLGHLGSRSAQLGAKRDAWAAAYGRNPNASEAYRHAVKAVEALAVSLAEPNNPSATLGKAIGTLRGNRAQFASILANPGRRIGSPTATDLTGFDVMLAQMDLLWHNQTDRHSPGDTHPVVPIEQALRSTSTGRPAAICRSARLPSSRGERS